jgi:hypothetical protein
MRTRVLRWPIVFLRARCSICVRYSTLMLLIKTVRCSIPHCIYISMFVIHVMCQEVVSIAFRRKHSIWGLNRMIGLMLIFRRIFLFIASLLILLPLRQFLIFSYKALSCLSFWNIFFNSPSLWRVLWLAGFENFLLKLSVIIHFRDN